MGRVLKCLAVLVVSMILAGEAAGAQLQLVPNINMTVPLVNPSLPKITNPALQNLVTMGEVEGQTLGASPNQLVALDQNGNITRTIALPVQRPAGISAYTPGKAIVGDAINNAVFSVDISSGRAAKLLDLRTTNYGGLVAGDVLQNGELCSVAFDGRYVYVAISAGYSSSIFAIDPATNRAVQQTWSPGDKPTAMQFTNGTLYVLDAENSQLRTFDATFRLNLKAVDLNIADPRGIVIRGGEVKVLTPADRSITTIKPDLSALVAPQANNTVAASIKPRIIASGILAALAQKYALLICGDVAESGYDEFWNDTVWMYKTLLAAGYSHDNIYVLYGWGADYPCLNPSYQHAGKVTDFPANIAWVNKVLNGMKNGDSSIGVEKLRSGDSLFVWVFDHGGGGNPAYFCLRDGVYYDYDFANALNALECKEMAVFMQQCRSGGFVDNLQNSKRFVSVACRADENAHRADTEKEIYFGATYHHGEYNYYVINALAGGSADINGDDRVNASEMHVFMAARENQPEHPQAWDGAGVGTTFVLK